MATAGWVGGEIFHAKRNEAGLLVLTTQIQKNPLGLPEFFVFDRCVALAALGLVHYMAYEPGHPLTLCLNCVDAVKVLARSFSGGVSRGLCGCHSHCFRKVRCKPRTHMLYTRIDIVCVYDGASLR